jgi:hypothetical protein
MSAAVPAFKVCHVVFSTNRVEYLTRTLQSLTLLDYGHCVVDHIFIDDYPLNRDTGALTKLATSFGFNEIIMHETNYGITKTWHSFFELIANRDYDYIFQHEDDVELLYPLCIYEIVALLKADPTLSQIVLKRNNWYTDEQPPTRQPTDKLFGRFRYETNNIYFWSLFSFYPAWIAKEPIKETMHANESESVIACYLRDKFQLQTGILKTLEGNNMVCHIGDYFQGTRCVENEPGWERFRNYAVGYKYCSKTGQILS